MIAGLQSATMQPVTDASELADFQKAITSRALVSRSRHHALPPSRLLLPPLPPFHKTILTARCRRPPNHQTCRRWCTSGPPGASPASSWTVY